MVDVGTITDPVPLVGVIRPRGVGRGQLPAGPAMAIGRGAAVQRILDSFLHERPGGGGGLAAGD